MSALPKKSPSISCETGGKSLKTAGEGKKPVGGRKRGNCSPGANNSLWLIFAETHLIIVSKW